MAWRDGLFGHWPVDPDEVRPHVPAPLELDTYDDRAWVSILPFVLSGAGVRFSPEFARLTFPELNVRTYVRFDGVPGLYFFSVDVDHPFVPLVVSGTTRLPCYRADMGVYGGGDRVSVRSVRRRDPRVHFEASYRPAGERFHADPETLDYWLAERRRMYDPVGNDVLYAEIAHDPWPLQPADVTVETNTVFDDTALPTPVGEPRFRYSDYRSITGSVPRWIDELDAPARIRPDRLAHR